MRGRTTVQFQTNASSHLFPMVDAVDHKELLRMHRVGEGGALELEVDTDVDCARGPCPDSPESDREEGGDFKGGGGSTMEGREFNGGGGSSKEGEGVQWRGREFNGGDGRHHIS